MEEMRERECERKYERMDRREGERAPEKEGGSERSTESIMKRGRERIKEGGEKIYQKKYKMMLNFLAAIAAQETVVSVSPSVS